MNDKPLVTCIIPTFNRAKKIITAIDSVMTQTYSNFEVLVVDDLSTDNTKEVVGKLAKKDSRIKYFLNPKKGANNARNFGIINARGKYIAFLDDDDVWVDSKLEKQVNAFKSLKDEYGVIYCTFARTKTNGKVSRRHPSRFSPIKEGDILKHLLKRNFITTSTLFAKTEVFHTSGMFDPTYSSFQDWELLIRIAKYYHFCYLDEILVQMYESEDSITLNKKGRVLTSFKLLKQNMDLYEKNHRLLSYRYCSIGFTLLKLNRNRAAKLFLYRSLKYNALNIEALIYLLFLGLKSFLLQK